MALLKKIETESGVVVEYHNATINKDTVNKTITIYINSYVSQKTREEGKKPAITGKQYVITPETEIRTDEVNEDGEPIFYNFLESLPEGSGVEDIAYTYLKLIPEFKGAKDV